MQTHQLGTILRVVPVDLSDGDFTDETGFFIRIGTETELSFCPINNKTDAEAITKTWPASEKFDDPVLCRKIFATGELEEPTDLYIGYGV